MQRTDAYIGTFTNDSKDSARIKDLRKFVKYMNKMLKQEGLNHQYYIKLQGRLGKNNPNAWKYEAGENSIYGGNYCGHWQCIRLKDAAHADAYIYKRNPY